jgi:hypothetical protein
VGVSIGLDRVFALVWPKWVERGMRSRETMVYVMAAGMGCWWRESSLYRNCGRRGLRYCVFFSSILVEMGADCLDWALLDGLPS